MALTDYGKNLFGANNIGTGNNLPLIPGIPNMSAEALNSFGGPNSAPSFAESILPNYEIGDIMANAGGAGGGIDWSNILLGGKDNSGVLNLGTQLLSGLAQYGLMNDQLDLAQDQFGFQKSFANRNLTNQARTVNTQLRDRQRSNIHTANTSKLTPGITAQDLESYMAENSLSEAPIA